MHIVFDMTFPSQLKTGTRVVAYQLLQSLQQFSEHRFTSLTAPQTWRGRGLCGKALHVIWDTIWIQAVLPYELRKRRADLLFAPSFIAPLSLPCPLVLVILDTMYLVHPEYYDVLWGLYLRVFVPPVVRRAAAIMTISHSSKEDIVRYYHVDPATVHVNYLGVDSRFQQLTDQNLLQGVRDRYSLKWPFILFVGALERMKNVPRLLEAFSVLRESGACLKHKLVLLGPTGKGVAEIRQTIARLSLEDHVVFLGYVPEEDLPLLYNAADLLVLPSLYEGFGLPLIEAMACGTPVIASNTSSIPEVVADAALLFVPTDPNSIAAQIHRILSDDALRQNMIAAGLQRSSQFTWDDTARRTLEVCQNVQLVQHRQSTVGRDNA